MVTAFDGQRKCALLLLMFCISSDELVHDSWSCTMFVVMR